MEMLFFVQIKFLDAAVFPSPELAGVLRRALGDTNLDTSPTFFFVVGLFEDAGVHRREAVVWIVHTRLP